MQDQYVEYIVYLVLLVAAGVLEYFKLVPVNTAFYVLTLIIGHWFGSNVPTTYKRQQKKQQAQSKDTVTNGDRIP